MPCHAKQTEDAVCNACHNNKSKLHASVSQLIEPPTAFHLHLPRSIHFVLVSEEEARCIIHETIPPVMLDLALVVELIDVFCFRPLV